ncbi:hypothetical protein P8935_11665 [Telmatobacter sp. DSM 110680]|uniref:Uncharacterized protein n=1 Tax=Telmatobacter sp. DSM 110680 TaxID=3036704 RepID=A0AAU7DT87_9BACT
MKGVEEVWSSVARTSGGEVALPDLKPLVLSVHNEVTTSPVNLPALKSTLVKLLRYLSGEGRTNANCRATDLFFCSDELENVWSEQDLPEDFHAVLTMMGEALHDTVSSSEVAHNFGCLPEQLLERAERLET